MPMTPPLRKFLFLAHVTTSVAWLGAVSTFLVLAVTGMNSTNMQIVRSCYAVMPSITGYLLVPLAFASLQTGILLSLGTKWGLLRYYWVLAKLLINSLSIPILLLHTRLIREVATAAAKTVLSPADLHDQRVQLVTISIASLLALLVATVLSVYKPRGVTPFGLRQKGEETSLRCGSPSEVKVTSEEERGTKL
jgi:hypothetical protein